jgi:hypothetical protein
VLARAGVMVVVFTIVLLARSEGELVRVAMVCETAASSLSWIWSVFVFVVALIDSHVAVAVVAVVIARR